MRARVRVRVRVLALEDSKMDRRCSVKASADCAALQRELASRERNTPRMMPRIARPFLHFVPLLFSLSKETQLRGRSRAEIPAGRCNPI